MPKLHFVKCLFISICLYSCGFTYERITVSLSKIIDGDTIEVLRDSEKIKIRLYGIDAPERTQDYGRNATRALESALEPYNEIDIVIRDKDRYGRIVGEIFAGGSNINLIMLLEGHCWHYKKYSKEASYSEAEVKAKGNNLGLWANSLSIPPWEFRRAVKSY